jgi:hypothetical protein
MNTATTPSHPTDTLAVHGISITSRSNIPREIAEMTKFCELLAQRGLAGHVERIYYDSKANLCSFKFSENLTEDNPASLEIKDVALETIGQFDWFGGAEQGKPCDEETERMVAELEAGRIDGGSENEEQV